MELTDYEKTLDGLRIHYTEASGRLIDGILGFKDLDGEVHLLIYYKVSDLGEDRWRESAIRLSRDYVQEIERRGAELHLSS